MLDLLLSVKRNISALRASGGFVLKNKGEVERWTRDPRAPPLIPLMEVNQTQEAWTD